ncbi:hypothetical protein BDV06DRAFT_219778 [Aspergillus oleicola]
MPSYEILTVTPSWTSLLPLGLSVLSIFLSWAIWYVQRTKQAAAQSQAAVPPSYPFDPTALDRKQSETPIFNFGNTMILANRYAHEIRNDDRLSFPDGLEKDFLTTVPGLEALFIGTFHNHIVWDTASAFSRKIGALIQPLSTETTLFLQKDWSEDTEWHSIHLNESMHFLIAQLTARVFIGEELCRNRQWIELAICYTAHRSAAIKELHQYGRLIPIVHWFLPSCRALRSCVRKARPYIEKVLGSRRKGAETHEKDYEESLDALSWIDGVAGGKRYDPTLTQLRLAYAAVHTTSDMMTKVIAAICEHEHLVHPIREEIIAVVRENGWTEAALTKMILLDSVLKETQRLEPLASFTLSRIARQDVILNDGTRIPKGTQARLTTDNMWNSSIYPDAAVFDGYRFVRLREEATSGSSPGGLSFVSVSANHMGFGYGKHACPGRFFAGAETKIALCHILLKYDFGLEDPGLSKTQTDGMMIWRDKRAMLRVRRRKEEIDF